MVLVKFTVENVRFGRHIEFLRGHIAFEPGEQFEAFLVLILFICGSSD